MTEREGEKNRKIELRVRGCGRDTGKHKNTIIFHQGKEFHFNNNIIFPLQFVSFIEKRKKEVRMKGCAEIVIVVVKHLFVDCLKPFCCSKSRKRGNRGMNSNLMRGFDGWGGC